MASQLAREKPRHRHHANLRAFDTANPHIAEGLIWASLLVSILKRFLAHAAQIVHAVSIWTRRAAVCLPAWMRQVASAFERQPEIGAKCKVRIVRDSLVVAQ